MLFLNNNTNPYFLLTHIFAGWTEINHHLQVKDLHIPF